MKHRIFIWVLWPSFIVAGLTSAAVFAFIDPLDVPIFGHIQASRLQMYAVGFFLFWCMAALSSMFSLYIAPAKD